MNANRNKRPIIIRRKKVVQAAHNSSSWKIALADFMTALMALFLVMWILSIATEEQRESVAQYFSTPLVAAIRGGDGASESPSLIPGGGADVTHADGQRARIDRRERTRPSDDQRRFFMDLQRRIEQAIEADSELRDLRQQMRFSLTPEGLLIQLLDTERRPMFEIGSDKLEQHMRKLLMTMAPLMNELPNSLSISGHTDNLPYVGGYIGYSNWELSTDRANASRRALVAGGLDSAKLLRVAGMADHLPLPDMEANDPMNRRIALLVLSESAAEDIRRQYGFMEGSRLKLTPVHADGEDDEERAASVILLESNSGS